MSGRAQDQLAPPLQRRELGDGEAPTFQTNSVARTASHRRGKPVAGGGKIDASLRATRQPDQKSPPARYRFAHERVAQFAGAAAADMTDHRDLCLRRASACRKQAELQPDRREQWMKAAIEW